METVNGGPMRPVAARGLKRAASLAALALMLASPAASAVIFVTTTEQKVSSNDPADRDYRPGCSLQEAIFSANRDENTAIAGYRSTTHEPIEVTTQCVAGNGDDIIVLPVRGTFLLTAPADDADNSLGPTATPLIQSTITIRANGSTLQAAPAADHERYFRLFSLGRFGNLTLTRAYVRGFTAKGGDGGAGGGGGGMGAGGAIYVFGGRLTVEASTFEGNGAIGGNGGGRNRDSGGGGGGGGGLGGDGGPGSPIVNGCDRQPGGGGGGARGQGLSGQACFSAGPGGGTHTYGRLAGGGFRCGGDGGSPGGTTSSELGDDGDAASCAGGGGGGGWEGILTSGNGGAGAYGGGAGGGSAGGGDGGLGGFGGGGGAGWGGFVNAGDGGDGGFGGGGGAASAGAFDGRSGAGGPFGGGGNARHGGGGAGLGGAIFNDAGTVIVRNSTLTNNYAARGDSSATRGQDAGGAIFSVDGHLLVQYATIARNQTTGAAGGIVVTRYRTSRPPVSFALENTIIYDNGAMDTNGTVINTSRQCSLVGVLESPVAGDVTGGKGNLIQGNDNCAGVVSTANPNLGPLQQNGGMTPTMAIGEASAALDTGDTTVADELGTLVALDQRRQSRPLNGGYDIGAFEACISIVTPCLIEPEFSDDELVELTVVVTPAGGGITSPAAGTSRHDPGAIVPLVATPAAGYAFDHWSGASVTAPTSASTTIVLTANSTLTAHFRLLPDFTFGAVTPLTIPVGGTATRQVSVTANAAFDQTVTLGVAGVPAGIATALSPPTLSLQPSASAASTLTIELGPAALPGSYSFSVTGVSGALARSTSVSLTVTASAEGIVQVVGGLTTLGCVDAGLSNSLVAKLRQVQSAVTAGDVQTAANVLHALLHQLQAQRDKHIRTCGSGAQTLDGTQLLIDHVNALLAGLGSGLRSTAVFGMLSAEVAGATVTIATGNKTVAAVTTDATGHFVVAKTTGFQPGAIYTAVVSPPKGYKVGTPSLQTFVWTASQVALAPLGLRAY